MIIWNRILFFFAGGDTQEHVFHLHGYSFYVIGSTDFGRAVTLDEVKELDQKGKLFKRNLVNPPQKDTIRVPKYGAVGVRFIAKNPGRCICQLSFISCF